MIWKSKSEQRNAKLPTGSDVAQMERTANPRLKMMQPRTTGPYHKSFQHFYFFLFFLFLPKLLAWGKRYILAFQLYSFSLGAHWSDFFLLPLARGSAVECSQDAVDEDGHDGGTDQTGDGHGHEPRHEDVSEQTPVHCLPWAQPAYCHHWAHLERHSSLSD